MATFTENLSKELQQIIKILEKMEQRTLLNLVLYAPLNSTKSAQFDIHETILLLEKKHPHLAFCVVPDATFQFALLILFCKTQENISLLHSIELSKLNNYIYDLLTTVISGIGNFSNGQIFPSYYYKFENETLEKIAVYALQS